MKRKYENMTICFARYFTRMLSHNLIGKTEGQEGKKHLITDDYMLDRVLEKIKTIIDIEKFNEIKYWLTKMINQLIKFR